jgi:hypothetical protein
MEALSRFGVRTFHREFALRVMLRGRRNISPRRAKDSESNFNKAKRLMTIPIAQHVAVSQVLCSIWGLLVNPITS